MAVDRTSSRKTWVSVTIVAASIAAVLAVGVTISAVVFFLRYVDTDYVAWETAAREFEAARARFVGQQPLIEFRGLQTPVVRRNPSAPRQNLLALHALAYSAGDGQLRRAVVPATVLRLLSVGGRIRFMDLGMFGDDRDRITLEDLERHGPGLILDTSGRSVGPLAISDSIFGTDSQKSQLLIWTE
jgi:hypothetical protein